MKTSLKDLSNTLPQVGCVEWIGIRPERKATMIKPTEVEALQGIGLAGDRYKSKDGKRQVTLIQWEHIAVIASLLQQEEIAPELLRRNIAVSGINLLALRNKRFQIGSAVLEYTGLCHPCSAMETKFGAGGYNAVHGHGGITARIIESGVIQLQDSVIALAL